MVLVFNFWVWKRGGGGGGGGCFFAFYNILPVFLLGVPKMLPKFLMCSLRSQ